jgi:hypothetical protein
MMARHGMWVRRGKFPAGLVEQTGHGVGRPLRDAAPK